MLNQLVKRSAQAYLPRARLNAVWHVDADHTYNVTRNREQPGAGYIAVRTLSGHGELTLFDGREYVLEAGIFLILRLGSPARYRAGQEGWQFYWFEFETEAEIGLCGRLSAIALSSQECGELRRCFMSLGSSDPYEDMVAGSLFNYMLADWQLRALENPGGGVSAREVLALLEQGRTERLSIADMARRAGMCERSFREAVRRATGLSPKAYMLREEMNAAMELLRTTDMSVGEIASVFGYASPFYFSRAFKKQFGISPQQVRSGIAF